MDWASAALRDAIFKLTSSADSRVAIPCPAESSFAELILNDYNYKDKLIVDERMKQFERDVLHWINYDYVLINDNLDDCYSEIKDIIDAEIKEKPKNYNIDLIRQHVENLTS